MLQLRVGARDAQFGLDVLRCLTSALRSGAEARSWIGFGAMTKNRALVDRAVDKAYRTATERLPPRVAGRVDQYRPRYRDSWGGPMNGQEKRQDIARQIARLLDFDLVVETGTYRGTTTEFLFALFGGPVVTVESNPRSFEYSVRRLAVLPKVSVVNDDSRKVLRALGDQYGRDLSVFFYLDAHWERDLPLWDELSIIESTWPKAVVMIDDFQVPGDAGYGYDDYGPGESLTTACLPAAVHDWQRLFPSAPADSETGARRGSCVLVSPVLRESVERLTFLVARS